MRTDQEILEMINATNKLLDNIKIKVDELKIRNLTNIVDKKELFLKEVLPLFIIVNILADRQTSLYWAIGKPVDVIIELNRLSEKTFKLIKENLELFHKYL